MRHAGLERVHRGDDLLESRCEGRPSLWAQRADEPRLDLLPDWERVAEEAVTRLGEGGGPLASGPPRLRPEAPAPDQRLDGAVERGAVQHERLGEPAERDRAAQVDGHEQGELGGGQIERREGSLVEARDRSGGAAELSTRALDPNPGRQRRDSLGPRGSHGFDVYASIGVLSRGGAGGTA